MQVKKPNFWSQIRVSVYWKTFVPKEYWDDSRIASFVAWMRRTRWKRQPIKSINIPSTHILQGWLCSNLYYHLLTMTLPEIKKPSVRTTQYLGFKGGTGLEENYEKAENSSMRSQNNTIYSLDSTEIALEMLYRVIAITLKRWSLQY